MIKYINIMRCLRVDPELSHHFGVLQHLREHGAHVGVVRRPVLTGGDSLGSKRLLWLGVVDLEVHNVVILFEVLGRAHALQRGSGGRRAQVERAVSMCDS